MNHVECRPVGYVSSALTERTNAPRQSDEGAPSAWLIFDAEVAPAIEGISSGMDIVVLTWLHGADRETLVVRPRGIQERPMAGVFSTRSPDRPNPIGLHTVRVLAVDGPRIQVAHLEAIDGTPILDVKSILGPLPQR